MQFYTVEIERLIVISSFDENKAFSATTRTETVRMRDLPYTTALAYKLAFPNNECRIVSQGEFSGEEGRREHKASGRSEKRESKVKETATTGGTYADAINAAMKGEAA